MSALRPWLFLTLASFAAASSAADVAVATLVDGNPRVLRGASWYKLVPGARVEDGDIVEVGERGQLQLEFASGSIVNLVDAIAHLVPPAVKAPAGVVLFVPRGWVKTVAKPPGVRLRTPTSEVAIASGAAVLRLHDARLDAFVESGSARFSSLSASGTEEASREARHDEYLSRSVSGAFVPSTRPPKAFVDALPRHFLDPLPSLAAKFRSRPQLARDADVSYAEAQPWLAGRDRAAFERRFAPRLADPAFRRAVEPDVARYPSWDRRLHPEKYAPPPAAKPAAP